MALNDVTMTLIGLGVFADNWSVGPMLRLASGSLKMDNISYTSLARALLVSFTYH